MRTIRGGNRLSERKPRKARCDRMLQEQLRRVSKGRGHGLPERRCIASDRHAPDVGRRHRQGTCQEQDGHHILGDEEASAFAAIGRERKLVLQAVGRFRATKMADAPLASASACGTARPTCGQSTVSCTAEKSVNVWRSRIREKVSICLTAELATDGRGRIPAPWSQTTGAT